MAGAIRAVALDVDGTLAGADHRVSAWTAATLQAVQRAGVTPVIVTGRTERAALHISEQCDLTAPVISCNGAVVTDPKSRTRLRWHTLATDTIRRIVAFAEAEQLELILWTAEEMYASRPSNATAVLEQINDQPVLIGALDGVDSGEIVKAMLAGDPAELDAVRDTAARELPLLMRSMDAFYETSNPGASKWEALGVALERVGVDPQQCLGIADGDTDVDWLTRIGLPVAVDNARPAVRHIASVRIGHHADDAVASFLRDFFRLPDGHGDVNR